MWELYLLTGLCQIGVTLAEYCYSWSEGPFECENGCCGDYGEQYCCFHWTVYAIVGGVIGGIVIIGGIAALIFFLCFYTQQKNNRTVQPSGGQVIALHNQGTPSTYPGAYPVAAPPYPGPPSALPPAYPPPENRLYAQQDPAYPPTAQFAQGNS